MKLSPLQILFLFGVAVLFSFYLGGDLVADLDRETLAAGTERAEQAERDLDKAHDLIAQIFRMESVGPLTTWSAVVTVSAYTARAEECDDSPDTTADMTPSRIGLLAVSRDMLEYKGYNFGDVVMLIDNGEMLGVFQIHDTMHPRWISRVDILHGNVAAARRFGIRQDVEIVRLVDYGE